MTGLKTNEESTLRADYHGGRCRRCGDVARTPTTPNTLGTTSTRVAQPRKPFGFQGGVQQFPLLCAPGPPAFTHLTGMPAGGLCNRIIPGKKRRPQPARAGGLGADSANRLGTADDGSVVSCSRSRRGAVLGPRPLGGPSNLPRARLGPCRAQTPLLHAAWKSLGLCRALPQGRLVAGGRAASSLRRRPRRIRPAEPREQARCASEPEELNRVSSPSIALIVREPLGPARTKAQRSDALQL